MKPKVLWIEDSARFELSNLMGPILFGGKYDFHLAEDVATAVDYLRVKEFDVVIVDIRLPPGSDSRWLSLYQQSGADTVKAQLGVKLLQWLINKDQSIYPSNPPSWINPNRIAVFSVEAGQEIIEIIKSLGITMYKHKTAGLPNTVLKDLIDNIFVKKEKLWKGE